MGRTFDTIMLAEARGFMRDDPVTPEPEVDLTETPRPVDPGTGLDFRDLPVDAPFVEVGPRLFDGSPEVLAATPTPRPALTPASSATPRPAARLQLRPVPARATVPGAGALPADIIAFHDPAHPLAKQYLELTAELLEVRPGIGPRALGFTTALAGTPLPSILLNLGTTAARLAARRVVLVECDLRQPMLGGLLGLPTSPGLVEALAGIVPLEQVVRPTAQPNLLVVPAGEVTPDYFGLLRVDPLRHLLQRLALRADLLLLALPRWDGKPDVLALSACCDALFLVAPEAEAEQPHVQELLTRLPALGAPLAGTVLLAA
jgi:Mrp family chromosome partitioning ATPase